MQIGACHLGDGDWGKVPIEGDTATYRVALKDFEKPKEKWSLKGREKIDEARKRKDEGNELYKTAKLRRAQRKYTKAYEIAQEDYDMDDEEKKELKELKLPCLTNLAAVELALKDYKGCIEHCGKALEEDSVNVKALLRRAKAHNALEDWAQCRADLDRIIAPGGLDEGNADAKKELAKLTKKTKAQDAKDRATYGNMFSKMAKMEQKEKKARRTAETDAGEKSVETVHADPTSPAKTAEAAAAAGSGDGAEVSDDRKPADVADVAAEAEKP